MKSCSIDWLLSACALSCVCLIPCLALWCRRDSSLQLHFQNALNAFPPSLLPSLAAWSISSLFFIHLSPTGDLLPSAILSPLPNRIIVRPSLPCFPLSLLLILRSSHPLPIRPLLQWPASSLLIFATILTCRFIWIDQGRIPWATPGQWSGINHRLA